MLRCWIFSCVASTAKLVAIVCTGALVLGAAGLLQGYRATSHWYVRDLLALMGATVVPERIVADRNRITSGGVTAGIDLGLTIAAQPRGEEYAKRAQLVLEYDPQPPFNSGSPEHAGDALVRKASSRSDGPSGPRSATGLPARDACPSAEQRELVWSAPRSA
jgi:cyclohexyl-isocyanide hydratase